MKVVIEIPDKYCGDIMFNANLLVKEYERIGKVISENDIINAATQVGILQHISSNIQRQQNVLNSKTEMG